MVERCRALDWAASPLGPVEDWSQSLRTMAAAVLASRNPMLLFWGPELIQLYNDAFRPSLGPSTGASPRHPRVLGMPAAEFWTDVWEVVGPEPATTEPEPPKRDGSRRATRGSTARRGRRARTRGRVRRSPDARPLHAEGGPPRAGGLSTPPGTARPTRPGRRGARPARPPASHRSSPARHPGASRTPTASGLRHRRRPAPGPAGARATPA